jgi:hypothetical protein
MFVEIASETECLRTQICRKISRLAQREYTRLGWLSNLTAELRIFSQLCPSFSLKSCPSTTQRWPRTANRRRAGGAPCPEEVVCSAGPPGTTTHGSRAPMACSDSKSTVRVATCGALATSIPSRARISRSRFELLLPDGGWVMK